MSNVGTRRSEPVIGDAHDMETYGRPGVASARAKSPSTKSHDAARHRARRRTGSDRVAATEITPFASSAVTSAPARETSPQADNDAYEARLVEREEAVRAAGQVRTVKIRGQVTPARRRPAVQIERYDQHPDRAAQWALFLGVFMVVVAIVTGT